MLFIFVKSLFFGTRCGSTAANHIVVLLLRSCAARELLIIMQLDMFRKMEVILSESILLI